MKQITKKDFTSIYSNLYVVQGLIDKSKEEIKKIILLKDKNYFLTTDFYKTKEKKPNISSQESNGNITKVYKDIIQGMEFYFVEEIIDYSKDNNVSWNNIEIYNSVYLNK